MLINDYGLIEQFNNLISQFEAAKEEYALTAQIAIHENNLQELQHAIEKLACLQTKVLDKHTALYSHAMTLWQSNEMMTSDDDFSDGYFSDGYLSDDDSEATIHHEREHEREHERNDSGMQP